MGTRDLVTAIKDGLDESVVKPFFAIELIFDTSPLRLWTGIGELDIDGNTYTGAGELLSISQIEETSDIAVRGANVILSGVPSEVASLALQEPYQGRVANVYFGLRDVVDTPVVNIFSGYIDQMNIDESPDTSTIELTIENKLIDLERARVRRYTSGYQKSRFPNDKGLDFVEDLQDKNIVWGRSAG